MIGHILFPYDFSAHCLTVLPFVRSLAARFDARVTLFSVVPPTWESPPKGMRPLVSENPDDWTRELQARLDAAVLDGFAGIQVDRLADAGEPSIRIVAFAEAQNVDLIMMPTHGLGLFRSMLIGSVTAKVLHDTTRPIWTAVHGEVQRSPDLPRKILCAIDDAPGSSTLLHWATRFSQHVGATLKLLHVVEPITDWPSLEHERARQDQFRQEQRARLEAVVREAGIDAPLRVAVGEIVAAVTEEARQDDADLIVIGRGSVAAPFGRFRTHAFGIIARSPCPVLSV